MAKEQKGEIVDATKPSNGKQKPETGPTKEKKPYKPPSFKFQTIEIPHKEEKGPSVAN